MLIAEELLLLAVDDETGKVVVTELDKGLAGAVLIELALHERVRVAEKGEPVRAGRLVLRPGPAPAHPVLGAGLAVLSDREGRQPQYVLDALAKGLRAKLADGLVEAGVLRREKRKVLGLFPAERLPAADRVHEANVREQIRAALAGAQPDEHTAALVALLSALNAVTTVFGDLPDKRAARRHAKEIAEGQWAATAVRKAVEAVYAATTAAVVAASTAATASGS